MREHGNGTYSHWGRDLWLSTSDNSSPLVNGRIYAVVAVDGNDPGDLLPPRAAAGQAPVNLQPLDASAEVIERDARYAINIAESYADNFPGGRAGIQGLSWLELGPGTNLGSALVLLAWGASHVGVADRFLVPYQASYHDALYRRIRALIEDDAGPVDTRPLDAVLERREHAASNFFVYNTALEDLGEVISVLYDVTASNAVLEHLFDPAKAIAALGRLTAPGGHSVHQVDFRDHRSFDGPLTFLLEDERSFASIFEKSNGETGNRVRPYQMAAMFSQAGFSEVRFHSNMEADDTYLREFVPLLRRTVKTPFHAVDETKLRSISGRFVVRK